MIFTKIGESTTVVFDMEGLEIMARICKAAVDTAEEGVCAEMALSAFTAATLIARVHGDMGKSMRGQMARIHERITRPSRMTD